LSTKLQFKFLSVFLRKSNGYNQNPKQVGYLKEGTKDIYLKPIDLLSSFS